MDKTGAAARAFTRMRRPARRPPFLLTVVQPLYPSGDDRVCPLSHTALERTWLYVIYLTYTADVPRPQSDADVLTHVSRRLFAEGREEFRAAHRAWLESCETLTADEHLRRLGETVTKERRAFEKQREAIDLQSLALDLRAKSWGELKAKSAGEPSE